MFSNRHKDMTQLLVAFYVFTFFYCSSALYRPSCGQNEEINDCPLQCEYDYCPKSSSPQKPCVKKRPCPPPMCKCIFNYRRVDNGTCIPTTSCPPFVCDKPFEEYNPCPPYCPTDSCTQATPTGICPYPGFYLTAYCTPACRCVRGYWRQNGRCVPYNECIATATEGKTEDIEEYLDVDD